MFWDGYIDLIAFSNVKRKPFSIQVKTNKKAKPGGGKGKLIFEWSLRENSPADLVALADLSKNNVWLFSHSIFMKFAQQKSATGNLNFHMYLNDDVKTQKLAKVSQFETYLIENHIESVFSI